MRFDEMCIQLFDGEHKMAYRKGWGDIRTTVRVVSDPKARVGVLTYYNLNESQIPFMVTKDAVDNEDWVCIDDINERFSIKNFMTMPKAKELIKDVYEFISGTKNMDFENMPMEYRLRMDEAVALRLMYPDYQHKRLMMTDIGYDLAKQLD